jgi:hypothetical protein
MSPRLSATIRFLRFPLIAALILLHAATAASYTDKSLYGAFVYPFAFWLGETVVPAFFFISGMLFFMSKKSYTDKLHSRIGTLAVPYLSWNVLQLLFFLLLSFAGIHTQIGDITLKEASLWDMMKAIVYTGSWDHGNATPLFSHFWYVRNLIVLCLLGPAIGWLIERGGRLLLLILFVLWNADHSSALLMESVLFFSLGAYAAQHEKGLADGIDRQAKVICLTGSVLFALDMLTHTVIATPLSLLVHRSALVANIPLLFVIGNWLCRHTTWAPHVSNLSNTTFWIFAVHYPLIIYLRRWIVGQTTDCSEWVCVLLYFACCALVLGVATASYWLMKKMMPRILSLLTGNRL